MATEFRQFEFRQQGRRLQGTAIRYGSVAQTPLGPERFEPGAFGDVSSVDAILNIQHDRKRPIARTGGGGLTLTDSATALTIAAELPNTRESEDALELVRTRVLRGLSIEFKALRERVENGVRVISRAALVGLGLVDRPAYQDSLVQVRFEVRQQGDGLSGAFLYNSDQIISDRAEFPDLGGLSGNADANRADLSRLSGAGKGMTPEGSETRQGESVRKRRVAPGAFSHALNDDTREISLVLGDYSRPLASRLGGTLRLTDSETALRFEVDRLPDTTYVRDFRAMLTARAIEPGVQPFFRIPPSEVVDNPVEIVPEPGNESVGIEVVWQAILTALSVRYRAPRGNAGIVERRHKRRRLWL